MALVLGYYKKLMEARNLPQGTLSGTTSFISTSRLGGISTVFRTVMENLYVNYRDTGHFYKMPTAGNS
jgi:hypothetical protein